MTPNPLGPSVLLDTMSASLPAHKPGDTTSDLSTSYEAIALFTHACMVSLGFNLISLNEPHQSTTSSSSSPPTQSQSQSQTEEVRRHAPRLPPSWNSSFNSHSFVYTHPQSALRFVIRVDRLGTKADVRGLAIGDERIHRLELTAREYVSHAALPLRIPMAPKQGTESQEEEEDRSALPEKLERVFLSPERITDLSTLLKTHIIQRLIPSLHKEGYTETPDDAAAREDADAAHRWPRPANPTEPRLPHQPDPARPYPFDDPLAAPPRRPVPAGDFPPPGFEDEYEVNRPRPRFPALGGGGGPSPFWIGHDDLNPPGLPGPHDPLRIGGGSGGGMLPRPGHAGMHPTLDDPLFGGPRGGGGDAFDPQAPPGARWDDPFGRGAPRFGGGRPGGAAGGGGMGGFGFGGDII